MKKAIHANTSEELQTNILGLYHDHCHHFYFGKTKNLPNRFKDFKNSKSKYVFIYEEDEPNKTR